MYFVVLYSTICYYNSNDIYNEVNHERNSIPKTIFR